MDPQVVHRMEAVYPRFRSTQIQSERPGQNTVIVLREPIADKNRLFKSPLRQQTELKTHSSLWRV